MRNMEVLIDTNVLINYITNRPDTYLSESVEMIRLCAERHLTGYYAFHSLSTIWYVLRKWPDEQRRMALGYLCNILHTAVADDSRIIEAVSNREFSDFEDCLQAVCAEDVGADYIVTCKIRDFSSSVVPAVTPKELLQIILKR